MCDDMCEEACGSICCCPCLVLCLPFIYMYDTCYTPLEHKQTAPEKIILSPALLNRKANENVLLNYIISH